MAVEIARPGRADPAHDASRHDLRARDAAIVLARGRGDTCGEIAAQFGLSTERVRQIVAGAGTVDRQAARRARIARDRLAAEERREEMLATFRAGAGYGEIAAEYGLPQACVETVLKARLTAVDRLARRRALAAARDGGSRGHSDAQLLAAVREAVRHAGEVPTGKRYDEIARARGLPSISTIENRLGGWNAALRAAGFTPLNAGRSTYTTRWTEEASLGAVASLMGELGDLPSLARYEEIAQGSAGLPSGATLRKRFGSWSLLAARLEAAGVIGRDPGCC